jgi:hypothetical protein
MLPRWLICSNVNEKEWVKWGCLKAVMGMGKIGANRMGERNEYKINKE